MGYETTGVWTKKSLQEAVVASESYADVLRSIDRVPSGSNYDKLKDLLDSYNIKVPFETPTKLTDESPDPRLVPFLEKYDRSMYLTQT